ncbi:L,D-transpeptidase family protein [Mobilitalea sibirica]|uniref:L,D-transpeptidase family protein n=1 Tax=Mobilitalea sibirica TaxID=1462919 RepID=A0A8J7HB89_9FIRM|nr:L,D-transpeptidase family protein [Mobilitalea sibirica]MBH1941735.1 L,D-transpeptidase family protein [Mobilitalea sibirica]
MIISSLSLMACAKKKEDLNSRMNFEAKASPPAADIPMDESGVIQNNNSDETIGYGPDDALINELTEASPAVTPTPMVREIVTGTRYIKGDGVRLRENPSTQSGIILSLNHGTELEYLEGEGEWSKVRYMDSEGYVRNDLISETKTVLQSEGAVPVTSNNNNSDRISEPKIIVKKSERILELWDGDRLYDSFSIGLGWEPEGDKKVEGDGRTPEGTYYVCTRNSNSRFYLSLGVSYPNKEDAKEALDAGTINQRTYDQIAYAIDNKEQPPWNTAMGGEIMIHGMGGDSDWTAGCVAVDNEVMDILWQHCPMKTPIVIEP